LGLPEMAKKLKGTFEVNMTFGEYFERYKEALEAVGAGEFSDGSMVERVARAQVGLGLEYQDIVVGHSKVCSSLCVWFQWLMLVGL
jgi:hypothetical protein